MKKSRIVMGVLVGLGSVLGLGGCSVVSEADGQRSFAVLRYDSNLRTRNEGTVGRGAYDHSPSDRTIHNGDMSASVAKFFPARGN